MVLLNWDQENFQLTFIINFVLFVADASFWTCEMQKNILFPVKEF